LEYFEDLGCKCHGTCQNPLHTASFNQIDNASQYGWAWGDLNVLWEERALAALSAEERDNLEREAQLRIEKEAAEREVTIEANIIAEKARSREITAHYKCNKDKKIMQPCKYLYSCEGDKATGGARPTTLHISSECWGFEYHDPKTGELIAKHACWHLHPKEEGWCDEWVKDRRFKPAHLQLQPPQQNGRFSQLQQKNGRFPQRPAYNAQLEVDGFEVAGIKKQRQFGNKSRQY
jgi:hypothetical protein